MTVTKEMIMAYDRVFLDADAPLPPAGVTVAALTAALSAQPAVAVPDGWKLVPMEPTPEMVGAWYRYKNGWHFHDEEPPRDTSDYGAYRAMLAASPQPAPQPVAVKPLEWVGDDNRAYGRGTSGLTYCARRLGSSFVVYVGDDDAEMLPGEFESIAAAKFAAQMDYEIRIRSALTTRPSDQQENERLRQDGRTKELALANLIDIWKLRADTAEARVKELEGALRGQEIWHEMHDKALSKQPPSGGPNGTLWARAEHQEQMKEIRAALKGGEAND